ncbi:MAG: hypothetical protein ACYDEA_08810 [Candidatus Dormibacteria bacterium]
MEIGGTASGTLIGGRELVGKIEQKALQLSALLRDLDNHPLFLDPGLRQELDDVLDQVGCRIAATRVLEQAPKPQANP